MDSLDLLFSWQPVDDTLAGEKAAGILALPHAWVPPFVAIGPKLARQLERSRAKSALAGLGASQRTEIEARLFSDAEHLIVRSDGPREGRQPGAGLSLACVASWEALEGCLEEYRARTGGTFGRPIVQAAVEPALLGVMSNARSVSARPDSWVVEGILDLREPGERRIRARSQPGRQAKLCAASATEMLASLRRVCQHLSRAEARIRCEWAWDGTRVWVLQADSLPESRGDRKAMRYLESRDRSRALGEKSGLLESGRLARRFAKLRSRSTFVELGMPVVPLQALTASQWRGLDDPEAWIGRLIEGHRCALVIRCDLASRSAPFLLPTSPPLSSTRELTDFVEERLTELRSAECKEEDILFLFSPLVAARVSALAIANAEVGEARIDALWGFPDGLLSLPHDSFSYYKGSAGGRRIRHKPACLMLEPGRSRRVPISAALDWEATLRADEVRRIGEWGLRLSERYGREMQLMALCRIGGSRGPRACIPFHCWPAEGDAAAAGLVSPKVALRISGREDLRRSLPQGGTVRLDLEPGLDRDINFLWSIGEKAARAGATLVFSGSLLGHTRAVLERTGAVVVSAERSKVDWSAYRPAIVKTKVGLRRVRMVAASADEAPRGERGFRRLPDLSELAQPKVVETDLPGQPALFMDDPPLG